MMSHIMINDKTTGHTMYVNPDSELVLCNKSFVKKRLGFDPHPLKILNTI